jgi:hypothetical protein
VWVVAVNNLKVDKTQETIQLVIDRVKYWEQEYTCALTKDDGELAAVARDQKTTALNDVYRTASGSAL